MSIKFLSAILGPETGASILWTPGKNALFLQENHVHKKFLVLGGGGILGFFGGGSADFIFMGVRIFLTFKCSSSIALHPRLKAPVAPVALELPGVSHVKQPPADIIFMGARIFLMKKPSGPPNAVSTKGRHREKTPNAIA